LYVVRELDEPTDLSDNDDYLTKLIVRAPLKGTTYVADRCQVYQLLTGKEIGRVLECIPHILNPNMDSL
jgi:hypothetical protein